MSIIDEVCEQFAINLSNTKTEVADINGVELLPNRFAELQIETPAFLENALFAESALDDTDLLKEKKRAVEPDDMIEKAHPEAVYVSNAIGDGGLVENQNEQHGKMLEVINRHPRGQHIHLHAGFIEDILKTAEELEGKGFKRLAFKMDKLAMSLFDGSKKKVIKLAFLPALPAIAWWGLGIMLSSGIVGGAVAEFFGLQDGIYEDANNLLDAVEDMPSDFPQSAALGNSIVRHANNIVSLATQLKTMTSSGSLPPSMTNQYNQAYHRFDQELIGVQSDLDILAAREPDSAILVPRAKNHLNRIKTSFNQFGALLTQEGNKYVQRARLDPSQTPEYGSAKSEHDKLTNEAPAKPQEPQKAKADTNKVLSFVNKNYQEGTTSDNLQERLDDIALDLTVELGVRNITGDRLANASALQLRRLFQLANNPGAMIGYQPTMEDAGKATELEL